MKTEAALAAKAIKAELKKLFPGITFGVTSKNYSGGCSVNVRWVDGPIRRDVEVVIGKYQYGHFDGMTDCYDYSNSREDIPQARFVFAERTVSAEVQARVRAEQAAYWADWDTVGGYEQDRRVHSALSQMDLRA